MSRRRLLAAIPAAAIAGALASCGSPETAIDIFPPESAESSLWEIPPAAWRRLLGHYPPGATGTLPPIDAAPGFDVVSRTKRGIPVGGIGTGSFMFNLAGSFGPWHMAIGADDSVGTKWGLLDNTGFEQRFLPQAAFHARFIVDGQTTTTALATEDVLPAWHRLDVTQGKYSALFPKAWFEYDLPLPLALKQITPYVARDERQSSLPAGLFHFAVKNTKSVPVEVALMFSFPNAPFRMPTASYQYTRNGLRSVAAHTNGIVGVRLQAEDPSNVHETEESEWVIAAQGPSGSVLTYTTNWDAEGDGSDLWDAFSKTGRLPNRAIDPTGTAGAVAVSFTLQPHDRQIVTFALTWDFPVVQFRNPEYGTLWWKRYTEWYSGPYRGWNIAQDVLNGSIGLESDIDNWWKPIVEDNAYPPWLRTAALNELYYDIFGGVFWENGCISRKKTVGQDQHLYFTLETDIYQDCSSFDVRHYEARHLLELFPTIERDLLLAWGQLIMNNPRGITPHDAGSPVNDPWFVANQYGGCNIIESSPGDSRPDPIPQPNPADWRDIPAKFVQEAYCYWTYTGDDEFAATIYPAAQRAMIHLLSFDTNGDGIPDPPSRQDEYCTTYDNLPMSGACIYIAGLTIGACEALQAFAHQLGHPTDEANWKRAADLARSSTETILWSEDGGYYRFDQYGTYSQGDYSRALLSDALCGQRYVQTAGQPRGIGRLPDILNRDRMVKHLLKVYQDNVLAFGNGAYGAVNATGYTYSPPSIQVQAVWPGASYYTAAIMYTLAKETGNQKLLTAAIQTGYGAYRTTYEDDSAAFWFDTPALWEPPSDGAPLRYRGPQYQRNRAAWELLCAVKEPLPALVELTEFGDMIESAAQ